ncbi:MAG: ABC transporter permease subunit [Clostridia bacterium]|nr:ABC transporter permease subunit [Clostridia bacterium]
MKILKKICRVLLIAAFWICVWAFAAWRFGKPLLFPSPLTVLQTLVSMLQTPQFYMITTTSLGNILLGILIALMGACTLAILTFAIPFLKELIAPIMAVIKATPVASFIILALIFIGSAKVPTFITVLIVFPIVWTNLDEGLCKIDPQLKEVARVYQMSPLRRLRVLYLPSVKPYFLSACKSSLGLAWKAGVAAEIIAMPPDTIGTMIGEAKLYIMTAEMFAWTLTVVLLSLAIEYLFSAIFRQLESKNNRKEAT